MEQTIAKYQSGESAKNDLIISHRLNQQHKLEEYTIDACRDDQKEVLSYILQYLKEWIELPKTPESLKTFTPLRMTLCGVAGSGKSTLINTLVTAIKKSHKKTAVCMCVDLRELQPSMLEVKHVTGSSTLKPNQKAMNYQQKT